MQILSHRGFWMRPEEKNLKVAFRRSFEQGFGAEADVRDHGGRLVISHDLPAASALFFEDFLSCYRSWGGTLTLAFNIKTDGLCQKLKSTLEASRIADYFVFDMSIPEMVQYEKSGLRYFTRESEIETAPVLYEKAAGVWIDSFYSDWITPEKLMEHLHSRKCVALVSPELHGRPKENLWKMLKDSGLYQSDAVLLCTDYPDRARDYFYGRN